MPVIEEGKRTGEYILTQASGYRSTDNVTFAAGNAISPCVVLGQVAETKEYVPLDPAAEDGSEVPSGINYAFVDAVEQAVIGVAHVRDCEVKGPELLWPEGATNEDVASYESALALLGIVVR